MQRFLKIVSWVLTAVFVTFVVLVATVYVRGLRPTIRLETSGKNIIIHLETLADYPTHIDRIVIAKQGGPDQRIFEAVSEDHANIHRFKVHAGSNDVGVLQPYGGTYKTVFPNGRTFVLLQNETYSVTVCEAGRCSSAHFTIR